MTNSTFKQKSKVGVSGNLINQLMGNNSTLPEVGKGATELHYSDRSCYEVIEVSKDCKTVKLESLDAEWDKSKQGGQGHQNWILKPTGNFITVIWRNNAWRIKVKKIVFTDELIKKAGDNGFFSIGAYLKKCDPELHSEVYKDDCFPSKVINGVTREKFEYPVIKLLFGVKDYRYDWEF
jgi:hypothetical protein